MPDGQIDKHWHLKKELNVGHLFMTLTLAGGIIVWGMQMDSRVSQAEARIESIQAAIVVERQQGNERHRELMQEVRAIRNRIDTVMDGERR